MAARLAQVLSAAFLSATFTFPLSGSSLLSEGFSYVSSELDGRDGDYGWSGIWSTMTTVTDVGYQLHRGPTTM